MSGYIAPESIDELTSKIDIVALVGEYVPLTQRGNDWVACCPFHHEKTPSFHVSSDRKLYHCFGCGAGGTAISFIQEMEKLSFPEAVAFLAKRAGVELQYTAGSVDTQQADALAKRKAEYITLYNRVSVSFHYLLMETEAGKFALDYIRRRGITKETLEKFKLGYSPADRRWLKQFLLKKHYSEDFLGDSGLFSKRNPQQAFFYDRLMFPIFDRKGDTVAFGGRFLRGDAERQPKYLNSGDLIQYKKGSTLYAFNFAKQAMRESKRVIFCEGYMDCIAYHQCGVTYAVAPLGTALTEEQVMIVKPFVDVVYLSFDSDGAGQEATKKAILLCRRKDISVRVIRLSGGKDPAEIMIKYGAETLTTEINNAILDNDYLLSRLLETYPNTTPENKAKAAMAYFVYVDALQSDVQKDACLEQLCQAYSIEMEAVKKDYSNRKQISQRVRNMDTAQPDRLPKARSSVELRAVMTAIADTADFFRKMRAEISVDDLEDPHAKELFTIMEECSQSDTFSVSTILNRCRDDEVKELIVQSLDEYSRHAEQSVRDSIMLVKRNVLEKKRREVLQQISRIERSALPEDKNQLTAFLSQKMDIDNQISLLKE